MAKISEAEKIILKNTISHYYPDRGLRNITFFEDTMTYATIVYDILCIYKVFGHITSENNGMENFGYIVYNGSYKEYSVDTFFIIRTLDFKQFLNMDYM